MFYINRYRLALGPEDIFPAAINDVTKATVWALRHLDGLNIDPQRVVLMGESVGGNLAAALSQRLTFDLIYKDLPTLRAVILLNPCLQMIDFRTPSYQKNGRYSTLLIDTYEMAQVWNNYLSGDKRLVPRMLTNEHISADVKLSPISKLVSHELLPEEFRTSENILVSSGAADSIVDHNYAEIADTMLNPDFAPLIRPLLTGLPETYIATAEFDVLRDDGIFYAKRLEADGVKTTWKHYSKGLHAGFSISLDDPGALSPWPGKYKTGNEAGDVFHFVGKIFE